VSALAPLLLAMAALFAGGASRSMRRTASRERLPEPPVPSVGPSSVDESHQRRMTGSVVLVVAAGAAGLALQGPVLGLVGASAATVGWRVRTRRRAARLVELQDDQLADAVRAVSSALRAGMSMSQAVDYARTESTSPLRSSLDELMSAVELGVPFDDALDAWAARVGTDDAMLVAGVLRLHRRSGGDLPSVLDRVTGTLRERRAAAGEVRALTAQARLSGAILGVLPIGFLAFLWLTSRREIEGAFRSPAGMGAVTAGLLLEGLRLPVDPQAPGGQVKALPMIAAMLAASGGAMLALMVGAAARSGPPPHLTARAAGSPPAEPPRRRRRARPLAIAAGLVASVVGLLMPWPAPLIAPLILAAAALLVRLVSTRRRARRAAAIDAEVPQLLDLLAAGSSAGLAAPLALRRAAEGVRGPLGDEIRAATDAVDLGARWRDELWALADRLELADLRRAVAVLTRTESLGSSLEEATAELAATVRQARRAAVTERARAAPVKMLFPLVFLVLPAFLLLTVVPVLLTTVQSIR
jgi:Flp pilus assembly protein TadB